MASLMWSSYSVGMELPGERATYSSLRMQFPDVVAARPAPLQFRASVAAFDNRFDLLTLTFGVTIADAPLASGHISTLVRRDLPDLEPVTHLLPASDVLHGKVAVVIGGSRGLGAALVHSLAAQGARVLVNYHVSTEAAEQVRHAFPQLSDRIELAQGDATDPIWIGAFAEGTRRRLGAIDILICSASPPIRPMPVEASVSERGLAFIDASLRMVGRPLMAFLPSLSDRHGCAVIVSSQYARTAPTEFAHYVAATNAIEGLTRAAAHHYKTIRFLVARPPKLLTDQTNTPFGRVRALSAARAAVTIVRRICDGVEGAGVELLENFPDASVREGMLA